MKVRPEGYAAEQSPLVSPPDGAFIHGSPSSILEPHTP